MKILVLSDSHRTLRYMQEAVEREKPTHIIHLGDHFNDAEELGRSFPMLPLLCVKGNCDFEFYCQEQALAEYDGVRVLAVHGHRYGVKSSLLRYSLYAKENQVDVALFGHTHQAFCEKSDDIWLLNPGSCGYCSRPSYGVIEIKDKTAACRIVYMDERR